MAETMSAKSPCSNSPIAINFCQSNEEQAMIDNPLNRLDALRGEQLPQSKLNESDVIEARKLHSEARQAIKDLSSMYSIKGLAARYQVHHRTMERALSGETWSHVPAKTN